MTRWERGASRVAVKCTPTLVLSALVLAAASCTPSMDSSGPSTRLVNKEDGHRIITVVQCARDMDGDGQFCDCECDEFFDGSPFFDRDCTNGAQWVRDLDEDGFGTCGEVDPVCQGQACGHPCSDCPPGVLCIQDEPLEDTAPANSLVLMVCGHDGQCGFDFGSCEPPEPDDECAGQACGMPCGCFGPNPPPWCVVALRGSNASLVPSTVCDGAGACVPHSPLLCGDECAGQACGTPCGCFGPNPPSWCLVALDDPQASLVSSTVCSGGGECVPQSEVLCQDTVCGSQICDSDQFCCDACNVCVASIEECTRMACIEPEPTPEDWECELMEHFRDDDDCDCPRGDFEAGLHCDPACQLTSSCDFACQENGCLPAG